MEIGCPVDAAAKSLISGKINFKYLFLTAAGCP